MAPVKVKERSWVVMMRERGCQESEHEGSQRVCGGRGLLFFETSAKTGFNVSEVFTAIANAIPETSLKGARGPGAGGQTALGAGRGRRISQGSI
jgi:hypothetical protein